MEIQSGHYALNGTAYSGTYGMAVVGLVVIVLMVVLYARLRGIRLLPYVVGLFGAVLIVGAFLAATVGFAGRYGVGGGVMRIGVRDPLVTLAVTMACGTFVLALCLVSLGRLRRASRSSASSW